MAELNIQNLYVSVDKKEILSGVSLTIRSGEVHAIMGPNGSGKSTLANTLMGHPGFSVGDHHTSVTIDGMDLLSLDTDKRAKQGLFLAFQNPLSITGVPVASLLRVAYQRISGKTFANPLPGKIAGPTSLPPKKEAVMSVVAFHRALEKHAAFLGIDKSFLRRGLNDGFSGGEKKKMEMLQALVLQPKFIIFDEIDTGLDVDALKIVARGINELQTNGSGILIITHYQRLLHFVRPQHVHILMQGKIVRSGDYTLAETVEKQGYQSISK